jgi:hypothetical protein
MSIARSPVGVWSPLTPTSSPSADTSTFSLRRRGGSCGATPLGDLLAARDHLGGQAGDAALVIFARGFEGELVKRAGDGGVTLISAADLFAEPR